MRNRALGRLALATFAVAVTLGPCGPAHAGDGTWILRIEPMHVQAYGHDPHVLTIRETDFDSMPALVSKTAVEHATDSGLQWRGGLRYARDPWGWGVDVSWFSASQDAGSFTGAADGASGPIDELELHASDRRFSSTDPSQVLFYNVREDNDLEAWTADFYATRVLAGGADSTLRVQLGLRFGDFDNDYRSVLGVEGVEGSFLDASSNYELMTGPLFGLTGEFHRGRSRVEAQIGQSLLVGNVSLGNEIRDFTGPLDTPSFTGRETFGRKKDVAIPVTELRLDWSYDVSEKVALGVGANASTWWNVSVPPGVVPGEGEALREATVVFFGLTGIVELTF